MMVTLARFVVPETADIGLELRLFFNFYGHNLNLVISQANFDLEHCWHDKLIGLYRVEVVLLLLLSSLSSWNMHLILLPI